MEITKDNQRLIDFMHNVLKHYKQLRGKPVTPDNFWDVVVLTTADDDQKEIFEHQISEKYKRKELPLGFPIHVIADPQGPKLGNGGSTFTALEYLHKKYSKSLEAKRVLLIHAGGQSKRMPSASILGKIFSPIPHGYPIYQMLDVKLAMYLPLLLRMPSGIFVASSDDFEVFDLGNSSLDWSFSKTGFTALAHPSPVAIGTKHGVYVIDQAEHVDTKKEILAVNCRRVLQKPKIELIYKHGAVLKTKGNHFPDGIKILSDTCYTDSAFFMAMDAAKALLLFVQENGPITCEIDAYGDFLQALGPESSVDYINNTSNVTTVTESLLSTRKKIYHLLKNFSLTVLLMNASKFIHIGTMKEYLNHFCFDTVFQEEMALSHDVFNKWIGRETNGGSPNKRIRTSDIATGCVMNCILPNTSYVPSSSILEYCNFDLEVTVGECCILSNCSLLGIELKSGGDDSVSLNIPHNVFLHTVPVLLKNKKGFVTITLHVDDDVKKKSLSDDVDSLPYLGCSMKQFLFACGLDSKTYVKVSNGTPSHVSLWSLPLFPISETMSESLLLAVDLLRCMKKEKVCKKVIGHSFLSMVDVLGKKNIEEMFRFRQNLFEIISSN